MIIFANRKSKLWEMASLHQKKELITTDLYLIVGKSVMFTLKQAFTKKGKFTRYCWHSNIFQRNADELLNVCSGGCKDYDRGLILFLFHCEASRHCLFHSNPHKRFINKGFRMKAIFNFLFLVPLFRALVHASNVTAHFCMGHFKMVATK